METNPFKDSTKIKVLLAEPSSGMVDCIAHDNRLDQYMEFGRLETQGKFKFFTGNTGRTGINYAREAMANEAMKLGMDYLFMIDDDMIAPRRCFERVFDTMIKEGADIAAPICTQRVAPFKPVMYKHRWIQGDQGERLSNDMIEDYEPNSIVRVDGIGFGVVLISVPFLVKLKEKMPRGMFFSNSDIGEDIWFCIKARKDLDAKIVVDTSVKVGHIRHPEIATEWDYIKATNRQEKFSGVYRPDGSFLCNNAIDLNAPGVSELSAVAA
jgi:hypothetical protein